KSIPAWSEERVAFTACNDLQTHQPRANRSLPYEPSIGVEALSASGPPERAVSDADLSRDLAQRALAHHSPFAKHGAEIRCFFYSIPLWAASSKQQSLLACCLNSLNAATTGSPASGKPAILHINCIKSASLFAASAASSRLKARSRAALDINMGYSSREFQ